MDFLIYRHILSFCPDHTEAKVWTQLVLTYMSLVPILLMTSQIEQTPCLSALDLRNIKCHSIFFQFRNIEFKNSKIQFDFKLEFQFSKIEATNYDIF